MIVIEAGIDIIAIGLIVIAVCFLVEFVIDLFDLFK